MFNRRDLMISAAALGAGLRGGPALAQPLAVDEGGFVPINGYGQWIGIRGYSAKNPVMLFLHGGPGSGIAHGSPVFAEWEKVFTIAYWDQPGGGATYGHNLGKDPGEISIERYVRDGIAVAEDVRRRMGVKKIVLFGISWGSRLGLILVHRRPDLFSAYVGTAQAVSGSRGGRLGYDLGLAAARKRGDADAVRALEAVGPPPYAQLNDFLVRQAFTNPPGLPPSPLEVAALDAQAKLVAANPIKPARSVPVGVPAFDPAGPFLATQQAMFADSSKWESSELGYDFKVPMFFFCGEFDYNTPMELAREYAGRIRAPKKAFAVIAGASHNTIPFHAELLALMRKHVLPVVRR